MRQIIKFIQEARTELAKVNWPTRQTVINLTLTVIGVSFVFMLFIAGVDYVFTEGIKLLTTFAPVPSVTVPPVEMNLDDIEIETTGGEAEVETL